MNIAKELAKLREYHKAQSDARLNDLRLVPNGQPGSSRVRMAQYAHEHYVKVLDEAIKELK